MKYVIEIRLIADTQNCLIMKNGIVMKFDTEELAQDFARNNIKGHRFIASFVIITENQAKNKGHEI